MDKTKKNQKTSIHDGHRDRLRQRYLLDNGRSFADHELLELLLFYAIPRVNTNETAHKLLDEFGSLKDVLEAPTERICKVKGAGTSVSTLLSVINTINHRIRMNRFSARIQFKSLSAVGEFLMKYYTGIKNEQFCVLLFDDNMRLLEFKPISSGSVNSTSVDCREIARLALFKDATRVIVAHNHPAGNATPSNADRRINDMMIASLVSIGVTLLEHIVVSDVGYTPTLISRIATIRSPIIDSNIENGFLQEFYNS